MPLPQLIAQHEAMKAQYGKFKESKDRLDAIRRQMDGLVKLGDLISVEDVIKAGGHLVAAGLSPMALAKLMSDMPDSGPQLAGWVAKYDAEVSRREAALQPTLDSAKFKLGVAALRVLVGHHFEGASQLSPRSAGSASSAGGGSLLPTNTLVEPSTPTSPTTAGGE